MFLIYKVFLKINKKINNNLNGNMNKQDDLGIYRRKSKNYF